MSTSSALRRSSRSPPSAAIRPRRRARPSSWLCNGRCAWRGAVARLPVPIVFDHFGGATAAGGVGQPGFAALLELVGAGHAYVKVSAAYRSSEKSPAYDDVAPLARALIDANPERILWGTDWPHPHAAAPGATLDTVARFYDIDDGLALNQL